MGRNTPKKGEILPRIPVWAETTPRKGEMIMASSCEGCASAGNCSAQENGGCDQGPQSFLEKLNEYSSVKKVIGVVSGKGGVGKSFRDSFPCIRHEKKKATVWGF